MKPHLSFYYNIQNVQKVRTVAFTVSNTVTPKAVSLWHNCCNRFHKKHPRTVWKCTYSSKNHQEAELTEK